MTNTMEKAITKAKVIERAWARILQVLGLQFARTMIKDSTWARLVLRLCPELREGFKIKKCKKVHLGGVRLQGPPVHYLL